MSGVQLLLGSAQATLVATALYTGVQALRTPGRRQREVFAMFLTLAVPSVTALAGGPGEPSTLATTIASLALLLHPLALLLLVRHFRPVPSWLLGAGVVGGVTSMVQLVRFSGEVGAPSAVAMAAYIAGLEAWCALAFVGAAGRSTGLARLRMRCAAGGSAGLGLAIGALLLVALGAPEEPLAPVVAMSGIAIAALYYLAFVPPAWLRRSYQLLELQRLNEVVAHVADIEEIADTLHAHLPRAAMNATGGGAALVARRGPEAELRVTTAVGLENPPARLLARHGLVGRARSTERACFGMVGSGELSPQEEQLATDAGGAAGLIVAPLRAGATLWGKLVVFLPRGSLFPGSDGEMLQLFADRVASAMVAAAALAEQRELTEQLMETNFELAAASAHKDEFLANMSHELRTPLNAIIGFTRLMRDGVSGPLTDQQEEFLDDVLSSGRHLLQLVNDILDLDRVEAGRLDFRFDVLPVAEIVGDAIDSVVPLASERDVRLSRRFDPAVGSALVDPVRLRQILLNYLSNAIKYTPDGGRVEVRLLPEGEDHYRVDVEDSGVGIAEEDLDRLFQAFEQLDSSTTKHYQGVGLGLALTRRLVEATGGRVEVSSEVGKGSVFSAVLPRFPVDEPVEAEVDLGR